MIVCRRNPIRIVHVVVVHIAVRIHIQGIVSVITIRAKSPHIGAKQNKQNNRTSFTSHMHTLFLIVFNTLKAIAL